MAAKSSFDLFGTLRDLDRGDLSIYESRCTTDEEHKDFDKEVGWMLPQWMSSSSNSKHQAQLLLNMSKISTQWGSLNNHPQLRTQLLSTCGTGKAIKHRFPKAKKPVGYAALHKLLLRDYADINLSEVEMWCNRNNINDVELIARRHGLQDKELEPIIKAFKKIIEAK